jgi:hypothetical protein
MPLLHLSIVFLWSICYVILPNMMDTGKKLVIVGITFTITVWLFVLLRCFVRFKIVNSFGPDDWLIILSVVSLEVQQ